MCILYIHVQWVSEWLLFKIKWSLFQQYHSENKLHAMKWWWCPLRTIDTNRFYWIFIVLAHWNNSPWVDIFHHSDTSWLRATESLFLLLKAVCWTEKQQIPILKSVVLPDRGSNTQSTSLETNTLTITYITNAD